MKTIECENKFWISVTDDQYIIIIQQIGLKEVYSLDEIYQAIKVGELIKN
jgi:hypothetical protein